jgi:PAS domain S-box-containing protein
MKNRKVKILVIDDNKDNLFTLKVLINEKFPNVVVLTALSGKEGLEVANVEEPHLILLDIIMPNMDGFEVCEKLKASKKLKDIPVVFVTAMSAKESRIKALEKGGEGFLTKPIDESELTAQIRAMLKIRTATIEKLNEKERLEALVAKRTMKLKSELLLRKQTEKELFESEEINRSITQTAANAIITINSEGVISSWNKAAENIFGYTAAEMIGNKLDQIIPAQFRTKHINGIKRLSNGGKEKLINKTIEIQALRKDGTEFPIELSLSSWKNSNNQKYFTGIIRDITERKLSKEKLIDSEERLSQIIKNSKDWIWEVDANGLYTYSSEMVEKLLGYKPDELVGKKYFYDLFKENKREKLKKLAFKAFKQKKPIYKFINLNTSKNGEDVWISSSGVPILDKNGNLIGYRGADSDITRSVKSKQVLLQYSHIMSSSKDMMALVDCNFKYQIANEAYCNNLNITHQQLVNKTPKEIFGDDFFNKNIAPHAKKCIENEVVVNYQEWVDLPKIGKKFIDITYYPHYGDKKKVQGFVVNGRDITDKKFAELKLIKQNKLLIKAKEKAEESEKKFKLLYENAPLSYQSLDVNTCLIDVNPEWLKVLGYKREEVIGRPFRDFMTPESAELIKERFPEFIKKGEIHNYEFEMKRKDGKSLMVSYDGRIGRNELGHFEKTHCIFTDITERRKYQIEIIKAKEKAEESEYRYKFLVNTTHNLVWNCDLQGKFTYLNTPWEETHGYKIEEMLGRSFSDFQQPEVFERDMVEFARHLEGGSVRNYETTHIIKDGTEISLIFNAIPMKDAKGNIIGTQGTAFNITDRVENEKLLKEAKEKAEESDRLKTEFLNNMSHEIRTPMNGILGFSGFLSDPELSIKKRENFVNIIQSSANQLLHIIDDILEISRLGTNQIKIIEEEVGLNDLLLEQFSVFDIKAKENKTPLYLKKGLSDKQSVILIDKTKLNKVLNNLLENALKFTNKGFVEFGYQLKNSDLEIFVKDTGIGIEPKNHSIIFDRFSQAEKDLSKKVGGLGLGLSIVKENITLLGGKIRLESEIGHGTTFFVTIPYKPVNKDNPIEIGKKADDINNKYTILIVEDEEVNYLYLETLIKDLFEIGCEIIHAKNGADAVDICKENSTINIVLMDLKMPLMNGYEATRQIKEFSPNLPIIAQTAYSRFEEKEKAILAGCDDFISKPISLETLKTSLDKLLVLN